ncbi:MAG: deoxyhypusine synthase [Candidatus Thermoplasmatota archaeon]|nr:deoxyhypusine synthase [Candidatus Thermoplasmatota archaeon]MEE3242316.1 deoxyhypusine synthase [Candidatus Thermoplasmatota archaeon]
MRENPVEDIDIDSKTTLADLNSQFTKAGGFVATKVATATSIIQDMNRGECTRFISFPADIMATGTRGLIRQFVERGMIDAVVTTCGTLDHDIARVLADYYHGDFRMDDLRLREEGVNRLGNVLVPDESYGIPIENWIQPILSELYDKDKRWVPWKIWNELGLRLASEKKGSESVLATCAKQGIKVFVPGPTDGAVGSQLWMFWQTHKDFTLDVLAEEHELSDIVHEAKSTGAIMIGGGISKHHTIWWNQFRNGLDYAVQVTTAPEWDGSLSGARIREAVSWGKVRPKARRVTVEGDATVLLPLIIGPLL